MSDNVRHMIINEDILLVSPHPDDVALSLECTIRKHLLGNRCCIWNVFTKKIYNKIQLKQSEVENIVKQEEYMMWAAKKCKIIYDNFEDAQIRLNCRVGKIVGNEAEKYQAYKENTNLVSVLNARLMEIYNQYTPKWIGIPMGIGNHIDHVLVRDMVISQIEKGIFLYEDMPYSANKLWVQKTVDYMNKKYKISMHKIGFSHDDLHAKLKFLSIYKSQVTERDLRLIRKYYEDNGMNEKIWIKE